MFTKGFMKTTKDWNGWPSRVRKDGNVVQIQRSSALPIENKEYDGAELTGLIAELSEDLTEVKVSLQGTGGGQGFRDDKFLVVTGWTAELTDSEIAEIKYVDFR